MQYGALLDSRGLILDECFVAKLSRHVEIWTSGSAPAHCFEYVAQFINYCRYSIYIDFYTYIYICACMSLYVVDLYLLHDRLIRPDGCAHLPLDGSSVILLFSPRTLSLMNCVSEKQRLTRTRRAIPIYCRDGEGGLCGSAFYSVFTRELDFL